MQYLYQFVMAKRNLKLETYTFQVETRQIHKTKQGRVRSVHKPTKGRQARPKHVQCTRQKQ